MFKGEQISPSTDREGIIALSKRWRVFLLRANEPSARGFRGERSRAEQATRGSISQLLPPRYSCTRSLRSSGNERSTSVLTNEPASERANRRARHRGNRKFFCFRRPRSGKRSAALWPKVGRRGVFFTSLMAVSDGSRDDHRRHHHYDDAEDTFFWQGFDSAPYLFRVVIKERNKAIQERLCGKFRLL